MIRARGEGRLSNLRANRTVAWEQEKPMSTGQGALRGQRRAWSPDEYSGHRFSAWCAGPVEFEEVVGGADEAEPGFDGRLATPQELAEAEHCLELAEHWLGQLFA